MSQPKNLTLGVIESRPRGSPDKTSVPALYIMKSGLNSVKDCTKFLVINIDNLNLQKLYTFDIYFLSLDKYSVSLVNGFNSMQFLIAFLASVSFGYIRPLNISIIKTLNSFIRSLSYPLPCENINKL